MRVLELHAPVKSIQRSAGRSSVAAAAYRSAEKLQDARTGLEHDYTKKQGVEAKAIIVPENAPKWAADRSKLWSNVEKHETRANARTARDLTVAFPHEFSKEQREEAGRKIGGWLSERYGGAVVDMAWHEPSRKGDDRNHHMHALWTTRPFDEKGKWSGNKNRALDDIRSGPKELLALREAVANELNNIAARERMEIYVEHLSFEKRKLDKEPTQHMGPIATEMQRKGKVTEIGKYNDAVRARNEERRRLAEEQKVVAIDVAREQQAQRPSQPGRNADYEKRRDAFLARRKPQQQPDRTPTRLPRPADDAYAAFYREAQERRRAMLEQLEARHGVHEQGLKQSRAEIEARQKRNLIMRAFHTVTGQTRRDRKELKTVTKTMREIDQQRQASYQSFEEDRQKRLQALLAVQGAPTLPQGPEVTQRPPEARQEAFQQATGTNSRSAGRDTRREAYMKRAQRQEPDPDPEPEPSM